MGVDYEANYGIGYKVEDDGVSDEDMEDGLVEYASWKLSDGFMCFEEGAGGYDGTENGVYVCIKDPFKHGPDLSVPKAVLDDYLKRINLSPLGSFGVVGGLHIY
jgi:hypothetical protein